MEDDLRVDGESTCGNFCGGHTEHFELEKYGPEFEHHPRFPKRTNTEFVHVISPTEASMRGGNADLRRRLPVVPEPVPRLWHVS